MYTDDGVTLVRSQNVLDHAMRIDDVAHVTDEAAFALRSVELLPGDVLVNITGDSVARCAVVDERVLPARVNQHVAIVRVDPAAVDPRYLQKYLASPVGKADLLQRASGGGTRRALTRAHLSDLVVPLPPLREQQAIAEVLGALDEKIAANSILFVAIDKLVEFTFERQFGRSSATTLTTIADVNAVSVRPDPSGALRYLDISSVGVGRIDRPAMLSWADAPGRARRGVRGGDTVWSTVRPNRRSHALILDASGPLVASTGLAVLSPTDAGPAFIYEATRRPLFTTYLENVAEGSTYPAVRAELFASAPVPDAARAERDTFESFAMPLRQRQHAAGSETEKLAVLRDALLPDLMSGSLQVRDAERTIEEVL